MTTSEVQTAIKAINHIIAYNNPAAASAVISQYGYSVPSNASDKIESALNGLYSANPLNYFAVMKRIPYLSNVNNWTTSAVAQKSIQDVANLGTPNNTGMFYGTGTPWWQTALNVIEGSTTTNPNVSVVTSKPAISTTTIIIIAVIFIGIIAAILYFSGVFTRVKLA